MLGTSNSTRGILCEALINHLGQNSWRAFSAGSHPKGMVHPLTLRTLQEYHIDTRNFRSKNWDEYVGAGAPRMDVVITVCDNTAVETCSAWIRSPLRIHWELPDPVVAQGDRQRDVFKSTFLTLQRRVKRMVELPATLDRELLQTELRKLALVF